MEKIEKLILLDRKINKMNKFNDKLEKIEEYYNNNWSYFLLLLFCTYISVTIILLFKYDSLIFGFSLPFFLFIAVLLAHYEKSYIFCSKYKILKHIFLTSDRIRKIQFFRRIKGMKMREEKDSLIENLNTEDLLIIQKNIHNLNKKTLNEIIKFNTSKDIFKNNLFLLINDIKKNKLDNSEIMAAIEKFQDSEQKKMRNIKKEDLKLQLKTIIDTRIEVEKTEDLLRIENC